jgi:carbamoyltransferase
MKLIENSSYKILSIIGGQHSCGLAYFENGEVKVVLEEERLVRIKPYVDLHNDFFRYPLAAITELIHRYNVDVNSIDYVTSFLEYPIVRDMLKAICEYDLIEEKFIKTEHHETHCALAYYFSGFQDDTLVVAIDGSGEHHSAKYYLGSQGKMEYIDGIGLDRYSIGMYYSALTELLGFKRLKDEGKVVGLAGHGNFDPAYYPIFKEALSLDDGIHTKKSTFPDPYDLSGGGVYEEIFTNFFKLMGSRIDWKRDNHRKNIAYCGQLALEETVLEILNTLHNKYPHIKKLALSGGVFANVKMNKRINELEWVDEVFITPPMGDEGLPLGSLALVLKDFYPSFKPTRLENVYFGIEYSEDEVDNAAKSIMGDYVKIPYNVDYVGELLKSKKILGLFNGKIEHGPRALGNRTITCDPTHPETYDLINGKLQRNDFMPFAPAVLDEDANRLFKVDKSSYTAEFMTMLYDTRDEWKDKLPTVTHPIDKTARIQIVTEKSNPFFYNILKKYKELTGIGCLVNTSFNVHNEPIVNRPEEAFVHLKNGIVDFLVTPYGIYSK